MKRSPSYTAQTVITHSLTGAVIQPGEAVDVGHLTPDEILMLEAMHVIQPAPVAPVAKTPAPGDGQEVE